jgi:hypothetical protein
MCERLGFALVFALGVGFGGGLLARFCGVFGTVTLGGVGDLL